MRAPSSFCARASLSSSSACSFRRTRLDLDAEIDRVRQRAFLGRLDRIEQPSPANVDPSSTVKDPASSVSPVEFGR